MRLNRLPFDLCMLKNLVLEVWIRAGIGTVNAKITQWILWRQNRLPLAYLGEHLKSNLALLEVEWRRSRLKLVGHESFPQLTKALCCQPTTSVYCIRYRMKRLAEAQPSETRFIENTANRCNWYQGKMLSIWPTCGSVDMSRVLECGFIIQLHFIPPFPCVHWMSLGM